MINYVKGDLFKSLPKDKKNVILHIVNDGGCMGAGFAKAAFERYPAVRKDYIKWFNNGYYLLGKIPVPAKLGQIQEIKCTDNLTIINLVAQSDAGGITFNIGGELIDYPPFRGESFKECLYRVLEKYQNTDINLVSPLLGCGLAGGRREVVFKIVEEVFQDYLNLTVYEL